MTQDNRNRPDIVDLLALHRCERNAVPAQRVQRVDLAQIRARLAATDPSQVDQMVEDVEKIRLGLEAFDLAQDYLAAGKLDRARHWLRVAAEYDVEDADTLLADVTTIQEVLESPQTNAITAGTALDGKNTTTEQDERQADVVDELHDAGAVLRRAREQAQTMVRKAQITAGEILAEARSEADQDKADIARLVRNFAVHRHGSNDTQQWWGRNLVLEQRRLFSTQHRQDANAAHCPAQRDLEQDLARILLTYSLDRETTSTKWPSWASQVIKLSRTEENTSDSPSLSTNCDRVLRELDLCVDREAYQAALSSFHGDFQAARQALLDRSDIVTIRRLVSSSTTPGGLREESDYWSALTGPRLWTPQSTARTDDTSPSAEQQLEREQIVAGPKFREALGELNKQLAAAGA